MELQGQLEQRYVKHNTTMRRWRRDSDDIRTLKEEGEGDGLHQDPEGGGGLCDYIRTLKVHLLYEPSAIIILQPPREGRDTETHTHTDRQTKRDRDRERYDQANRPIRRFFSGSRSSATRTRVTSSSSASKPDTSLQGGRGVRERGVRERGERKGSGKY